MKLLVVDDQHSVHMYLQKALDFSALGFDDVLHAQNGVQALALIRAHHPQIMLLDIQMPQMNGLQLLEALPINFNCSPDDDLREYQFNFGSLKHIVVEHDGELWLYV